MFVAILFLTKSIFCKVINCAHDILSLIVGTSYCKYKVMHAKKTKTILSMQINCVFFCNILISRISAIRNPDYAFTFCKPWFIYHIFHILTQSFNFWHKLHLSSLLKKWLKLSWSFFSNNRKTAFWWIPGSSRSLILSRMFV